MKICFILFTQHKFDDMDAYTGTANNAGAILVLGRDLVVVPKLIHPLPPAITSPEASPDHIEGTWMQVTLILLQSRRFCGGKACLGFSLPQTRLMWEPPELGLPFF